MATSAATCSTGMPLFEKRYASETVTYPPITPKGRMRNMKTIGCGCLDAMDDRS